jgi:hypothetical protein
MNGYIFPKSTEELLFVIQKHRENPAPAIDDFLQKFGARCGQQFMKSLDCSSALFTDEELLERMREQ